MEIYETRDEVAARRAYLEREGYAVIVTVNDKLPSAWERAKAQSREW